MVHLHEVRDMDTHYVIDPITMAITNTNEAKNKLMLGDHDSEIYTFEIPKVVEGHDMSLCNMVEVHYINVGSNKAYSSADVYRVKDMAISTDDVDTLVFSWKVSGNATKYAGTLNYRIKFACIDEAGNYVYKKWTAVYKGITVEDGFDNGETIAEEYSDILAQWEARLDELQTKPLIVTLDSDGKTANVCSDTITYHVSNGGTAYLEIDRDDYVPLLFSSRSSNYVFFGFIGDDLILSLWCVGNDGNGIGTVDYCEYSLTTADYVAAVEKKVDTLRSDVNNLLGLQNEAKNSFILTDQTTGQKYEIYVNNGKLTMTESEG